MESNEHTKGWSRDKIARDENDGLKHSKIWLDENASTKGGRFIIVGSIEAGRGIIPALPLRVYGSFAVVYITEGRGRYWDANGYQREIVAGDLIYVFPELGHTYGPIPGTLWSEYYVVFDGPAALALRSWGVLNSARPVVSLLPVSEWLPRLQSVVSTDASLSPRDRQVAFYQFLALLGEIDAAEQVPNADSAPSALIAECCLRLSQDLKGERSVEQIAEDLDVAYSTLRRRFREEVGVSMNDFRAARRVEAAKSLLEFTALTNAQIAARLGYSDEYHFSKQYKKTTGQSPRATRNARRAKVEELPMGPDLAEGRR